MSERVPIALLIDDSCPLVHVYRYPWEDIHKRAPMTADNRPLLDVITNEFLDRFCDVVQQHRMAGKFSIASGRRGGVDELPGNCAARGLEEMSTNE